MAVERTEPTSFRLKCRSDNLLTTAGQLSQVDFTAEQGMELIGDCSLSWLFIMSKANNEKNKSKNKMKDRIWMCRLN